MTKGAFTVHLLDAIRINQQRREIYAAVTQGRSRRLSSALIWFERLCLPVSVWIDHRAKPFNAQGISIVSDDFIDMAEIAPADTPPRFTGQASADDLRQVRRNLSDLSGRLTDAMRSADFEAAAGACEWALDGIEDLEEASATHHAMSRHIVESIGLAAVNALRYHRQSQGGTLKLSRDLVRLQALSLLSTTFYDRMAQRHQARGVGILVNDVPSIPFRAAWQAHQGKTAIATTSKQEQPDKVAC